MVVFIIIGYILYIHKDHDKNLKKHTYSHVKTNEDGQCSSLAQTVSFEINQSNCTDICLLLTIGRKHVSLWNRRKLI